MDDLSPIATEQIKLVVKSAVREAMAEKFEITFGINCNDPAERDALREDMKFLRAIKTAASEGGKRAFIWLVGIMGTAAVTLLWPYIRELFWPPKH